MYIAIEGCIGSGKTTLARLLSAERNSSLLLEDYQANPFLDKFYSDRPRYALETELAFVLIHYHQVFHTFQLQQKDVEYIAGFHISKDLVFAEMNLNNDDLLLFKDLYLPLAKRLPEPDIMICLKCSDELILKRIKQRDRGNESDVGPEYFLELNKRYDAFFAETKATKIEVNMDELDFINHPENIVWLSDKIDNLKE